jgi:hypothetical protein
LVSGAVAARLQRKRFEAILHLAKQSGHLLSINELVPVLRSQSKQLVGADRLAACGNALFALDE